MLQIIAIGAGGALGSVLRHFVNNTVVNTVGGAFPWGIFFINVTGSLVMGVLAGLFAHVWEPPQSFKAFLTVGILGGYTTFSTFSLDAVMLAQRGQALQSILYAGGSVALGIAALYGGMMLVRTLAP
jgi:CrcB protein